MTALFGILGYTFVNCKKYTIYDAIVVLVCIIGVLLTLIILLKLFIKETNKLEQEE